MGIVFWIKTPTREAETQSGFSCDVQFYYLQTLERFNDFIEDFKLKTIGDTVSINETEYGEDKKTQRLIVMDGVSGLVDQSNTFAHFSTVTRKFGYHCVYTFHIVLPENKFWKKKYRKQTFSIFFHPRYLIKLSLGYYNQMS